MMFRQKAARTAKQQLVILVFQPQQSERIYLSLLSMYGPLRSNFFAPFERICRSFQADCTSRHATASAFSHTDVMHSLAAVNRVWNRYFLAAPLIRSTVKTQ